MKTTERRRIQQREKQEGRNRIRKVGKAKYPLSKTQVQKHEESVETYEGGTLRTDEYKNENAQHKMTKTTAAEIWEGQLVIGVDATKCSAA